MIKITHGLEIFINGTLKIIVFVAILTLILSLFIDVEVGWSFDKLRITDIFIFLFWVIYEDSYIRNQYRSIGIDNIDYKILTAYLNEHFLVHKSISEIEALIASDKGLQK